MWCLDASLKPELDDSKHVLCRKHRDLLWLKDEGTLQFIEAFTSLFDQIPVHWFRELKVVMFVTFVPQN